jgi:hypothetical protein
MGFVSAGQQRNNQNHSHLKHTDKVMSKKGQLNYKTVTKLSFKKSSDEKLALFIKKFKEDQHKDLIKQLIIGAFVSITVFFVFYWILF